jgi:hypothetical protein
MSKRRKGFPSEMRVKRGERIVHGNKELAERLGRDDLCPCGSGKRFKKCCRNTGRFCHAHLASAIGEIWKEVRLLPVGAGNLSWMRYMFCFRKRRSAT